MAISFGDLVDGTLAAGELGAALNARFTALKNGVNATLTWLGAWDGSTGYEVNDAVTSGGALWVALADVASGGSAPSEGANWHKLAGGGDADTLQTHPASDFQLRSEKGANSGYASLDSGGKVPTAQLPAAIVGAVNYQGTWNASTNSPSLSSGAGTKGFYYRVATAGTTALDGLSSWAAGDWVIFDGTAWQKVDNTDQVVSVNGAQGTVVLAASDVGAASTSHKATHVSGGGDAFASTDVLEAISKRLQTTTGPTTLLMGAVADGEYLKRSGTAIVGGTPAGGGSLTVQEADGTPTGTPGTLKLPNGTLTDNGDGSFTMAIPESAVTGLTSDLAAKAALAGPTFTGDPKAPTASVDDNDTSIATTAYVIGQLSASGDGTPAVDGTAARGSSTHGARADHVHPTDTSRAPLASPTFTGTPAAPTAGAGTNTTQLATTAFVTAAIKPRWFNLVIGDGANAITAGDAGSIRVPAGTITEVSLLADASGSIVVDVRKCSYSSYNPGTHPVSGDSICASAKPTLSSAYKEDDSTLTGWTTSTSDGDILQFNVDSASTVKRVTVSIKMLV